MNAIRRHFIRSVLLLAGLSLVGAVTLHAQATRRPAKVAKDPAVNKAPTPSKGPKLHATPAAACAPSGTSQLVRSADGKTIDDKLQGVTWLADGNYAHKDSFGVHGISPSGSMSYDAAVKWVKAMNATKYLGHDNWTIPATPKQDATCRSNGPNANGFGYGCQHSKLGSLYYAGLHLCEPNTAVRLPPSSTGPFRNFQPYLYWGDTLSGHKGKDSTVNSRGYYSFSFSAGYKGSNVLQDFLYVIPMIKGTVNAAPAGQLVYDPANNVTWSADANLAASHRFGVDGINADGAMDHAMARAWVKAMNDSAYLGQKRWVLPTTDTAADGSCSRKNFAFNCTGSSLGKLYYQFLHLPAGQPVAPPVDLPAGPFHDIQPYLYWSCLGGADGRLCGSDPALKDFQFSFSFGNGFQGTDYLDNYLFVMVYYPDPVTKPIVPKCRPGTQNMRGCS